MIPGLLLASLFMGILFAIGKFSKKTKALAYRLQGYILDNISRLLRLLPYNRRQMIVAIVVGILLILWSCKKFP